MVSDSASYLLDRRIPMWYIILQVLDEWFQARPLTYSVEEFLHEVKKWQSERYVKRNVWIRLQEYVGRELLQTIEGTSVSFKIVLICRNYILKIKEKTFPENSPGMYFLASTI